MDFSKPTEQSSPPPSRSRGSERSTRSQNRDREIELKLRLPARDLDALKRHPIMVERCRGAPRTRAETTIYYDAPGLPLAERMIGLRVREAGGKFVQTLKANRAEGSRGALADRHEWEWTVAGQAIDVSKIESLSGAEWIPRSIMPFLHAIFRAEIERTEMIIDLGDGTRLAADFDRGRIKAAGITEEIAELELELKAGDPARLFEFALMLSEIVPVRISTETKAAVGYRLLRGNTPKNFKAKPLKFPDDITVGEGFRRIVSAILTQILDNLPAVQSGDAEGIHQMRIGCRRLRTAFKLFRPVIGDRDFAWLKAETKWLAGLLGTARDWQVFLTETMVRARKKTQSEDGLEDLQRVAEQHLAEARTQAVEAVGSARFSVLVLRIGLWIEAEQWRWGLDDAASLKLSEPLSVIGASLIERFLRAILKEGKSPDDLSPGKRHKLRKDLKKLRYSLEDLSALFDEGRVRTQLRAIEELQDLLGELNDYTVAERLVQTIAQELQSKPPAEIVHWLDKRIRKRLADLPDAWDEFVHVSGRK